MGELVPGKASMSMDTLYWRFETYTLGQQNIPQEATRSSFPKMASRSVSSSAWKRLRGLKRKKKKKKGVACILPRFPTANIHYFVTRETTKKQTNKKPEKVKYCLGQNLWALDA